MTDNNQVSEWIEQISFSKLFFEKTDDCRKAQATENYKIWKTCLDAKTSLALGILNDEETNKIKEERKTINEKYLEMLHNSLEVINETDRLNLDLDSKKFMEILFDYECTLDKMVNKHMPFLKISKTVPWEDLMEKFSENDD